MKKTVVNPARLSHRTSSTVCRHTPSPRDLFTDFSTRPDQTGPDPCTVQLDHGPLKLYSTRPSVVLSRSQDNGPSDLDYVIYDFQANAGMRRKDEGQRWRNVPRLSRAFIAQTQVARQVVCRCVCELFAITLNIGLCRHHDNSPSVVLYCNAAFTTAIRVRYNFQAATQSCDSS